MKKFLFVICALFVFLSNAQQNEYRAEREKVNELIHTKLNVNFNFDKSELNGEAWLTITPYFYKTKTLVLDAKSFVINDVKVNNQKAPYNYSDNQLTIELPRYFTKDEEYNVYINYVARPEHVTQKGSKAIQDAKGLYFIDPKDEDPTKPTQIWTQGETESSSCWFPTIDSPNQKTSQEIYITVPDKFVTLSNGKLVSQVNNDDGTRTDYWKMTQKHAPYLFFMGVGEFSIIEDSWNTIPVSYYVEPTFKDVAKDIFGLTPEMIEFYSNLTKIPYPWDKYSQIVVRDYVSGAMENTTAVVHGEDAQQYKGQLIDGNEWEGTIAHELFHHWFGDLVTTESWANLTVNESFATYGVYLWFEHKYGKDRANAHLFDDNTVYFSSQSEDKNLVRFYYEDKEHMFDPVSYHKGSAILHMLRDFVGDEAFFESLHYYLNTYKYSTAEAHQLRLAFEKVTGKDLNWFFNQWYFGNGHIKMNISYDYNTISKTVTVNVTQPTKIFSFPLSIDIYENNKVTRHEVWVDSKQNSFTFPFTKIPNLINIDAKHVLLAEIKENKTLENYIFQFNNAPHYLDRRLALTELLKNQTDKEAFNTVIKAFDDPYYEIQLLALQEIDLFQKYYKKEAINKIEFLARNATHSKVKAEAIKVLGKLIDITYKPLFEKELSNESYSVVGSSLISLYQLDKKAALTKLATLPNHVKNYLADIVTSIYISEKDQTQLEFIANHVLEGMFLTDNPQTQNMYGEAFKWIAESNNTNAIQNLVNDFVKLGEQYKKYNFDTLAINMLNQLIQVQTASQNDNKEAILLVLKTGLAKLID